MLVFKNSRPTDLKYQDFLKQQDFKAQSSIPQAYCYCCVLLRPRVLSRPGALLLTDWLPVCGFPSPCIVSAPSAACGNSVTNRRSDLSTIETCSEDGIGYAEIGVGKVLYINTIVVGIYEARHIYIQAPELRALVSDCNIWYQNIFWGAASYYVARSDSGGLARLVGLVPDQPDTKHFPDVGGDRDTWKHNTTSTALCV
ncbi:hypothetical protein C8J57DRAFT_1479620 [Mycena rebaudengoi]|nr:hypothetical protein C8J57DRAFT_1479620 [Mycena rebaudengoi]